MKKDAILSLSQTVKFASCPSFVSLIFVDTANNDYLCDEKQIL